MGRNDIQRAMRILFLTNYYPPLDRGGYEQLCHEVAEELVRRGHRVSVLTSRSPHHPRLRHEDGVEVHRSLYLEVVGGTLNTALRCLLLRRRLERENLREVRRIVSDFRPDVALIWGMWNVPRSVPFAVEQLLSESVAYYLCDYWPSLPTAYVQQLSAPARRGLTSLPKRLFGRLLLAVAGNEPGPPLRLERPICVSQAVPRILVRSGVAVDHSAVIHGGIRPEEFSRELRLDAAEALVG